MKKKIWIVCLCFFVVPMAFADVVRLKSGKVVTGEIFEQTPDYVKIKVEDIDLTYWAENIQEVEIDSSKNYLDAAGMSPRAVYRAYVVAWESKDWPGMKKYLTKNYLKEKEGQKGAAFFESLIKFKKNNFKIAAEHPEGEKFVLVVFGETPEGKARDIVTLEKEDGLWKINKENWLKGEGKKMKRSLRQ